MNIDSYFKIFKTYFKSWKSKKKYIVIESDDWGSIRIPSKSVLNKMELAGIDVKSNPFNYLDGLETNNDLIFLLFILRQIKKKYNKKVRITLNFIVGNPDFKKIKESSFEKYFHENFIDTYNNDPKCTNVFNLISEGITEGFFQPQFHGTEHVNVNKWMEQLKSNHQKVKSAFDLNTFAGTFFDNDENNLNLWQAYEFKNHDDLQSKINSIVFGLEYFKSIFGFNSKSVIAPAAVWNNQIEEVYKNQNISYIQSYSFQKESLINNEINRIYHYTGEKTKFNQRYLVRNCYFEPSLNPKYNFVKQCLWQIKIAFLFNNPAIITMHRINFTGRIEPKNRLESLKKFQILIEKIIQKWPDVEFFSSDELGDLIEK